MTSRSVDSVRYSVVINSAFDFLDSENVDQDEGTLNCENDRNQNTQSTPDAKNNTQSKCLTCDKDRISQANHGSDTECSIQTDSSKESTVEPGIIENNRKSDLTSLSKKEQVPKEHDDSGQTVNSEAISHVADSSRSPVDSSDQQLEDVTPNDDNSVSTTGVVLRKKSLASKRRSSDDGKKEQNNRPTNVSSEISPHIELNVRSDIFDHPKEQSLTSANDRSSAESNCQSVSHGGDGLASSHLCAFCGDKVLTSLRSSDIKQENVKTCDACGRVNGLRVDVDSKLTVPNNTCESITHHEEGILDRVGLSDSPKPSEDSDDDDDAGVYSDSYRHSKWIYIGDDGNPSLCPVDVDGVDKEQFEEVEITEYIPVAARDSGTGVSSNGNEFSKSNENVERVNEVPLQQHCQEANKTQDPAEVTVADDSTQSSQTEAPDSNHSDACRPTEGTNSNDHPETSDNADVDDVFDAHVTRGYHKRSESVSTTASELEFRKRYQAVSRKVIRRKSSLQAYQRKSERFYDEGRTVIIKKDSASSGFGFHIHGCRPVMVSTVEPESPAARSGLKVGDILLAVNDVNIQEAEHHEVVSLMQKDNKRMKLEAIEGRLYSDMPLCTGYLTKQGGTGFLKSFKYRKRWFVLKRDHCLYYYKSETDKDPLGAIPLTNYSISKAPELNKNFAFKAFKYGHRTYLFIAESEEDMARWAGIMRMAAEPTAQGDTWLDISSHNVGLPALSIKKPDCHGYLNKLGNSRRTCKRRYCVLKDACMYYYVDAVSATAQGVAHLHGYRVEPSIPFNKKLGFTLYPPEDRMRTFYFYPDNETDMNRWLLALQKSIGRWVKSE